MSFSSDVKERLCRAEFICPRCVIYETAGALLFGGGISERRIKFTTEKEAVARRIQSDIEEAFGIKADITQTSKIFRIELNDAYEVENIRGGISLRGDIPFSCCRAAFARGAFLGGGSVTDPQKSYHIEFNSHSGEYSKYLQKLLSLDGFDAKITERKGRSVVYLKGSEDIADILGLLGAPQLALEMFSIQVEKDMRNRVNRRVNCENANTNKAARASSKHLWAIGKIKNAKKWDRLPDTLKEIGNLREQYPEDSLKELGEKTEPPISKSGVNHRLNRILDIAENL